MKPEALWFVVPALALAGALVTSAVRDLRRSRRKRRDTEITTLLGVVLPPERKR
jgi:hypothetical protein